MARERIFRHDRLLKLIKDAGWVQEELAEKLGMEQPQVNRYIKHRAEPTSAIVARIATAMNVTTDYLLGLSPEPKNTLKTESFSGDVKEFGSELENKDAKSAIDLLSKKP